MIKTSGWAAASRQSGNTCARDSSMRCTSPFPRSSSAPGNTFSPVSMQPSSVMSAASTLPRRTPRTLCLQSRGHDHHRPRSKRSSNLLEAELGHDVSAFTVSLYQFDPEPPSAPVLQDTRNARILALLAGAIGGPRYERATHGPPSFPHRVRRERARGRTSIRAGGFSLARDHHHQRVSPRRRQRYRDAAAGSGDGADPQAAGGGRD